MEANPARRTLDTNTRACQRCNFGWRQREFRYAPAPRSKAARTTSASIPMTIPITNSIVVICYLLGWIRLDQEQTRSRCHPAPCARDAPRRYTHGPSVRAPGDATSKGATRAGLDADPAGQWHYLPSTDIDPVACTGAGAVDTRV